MDGTLLNEFLNQPTVTIIIGIFIGGFLVLLGTWLKYLLQMRVKKGNELQDYLQFVYYFSVELYELYLRAWNSSNGILVGIVVLFKRCPQESKEEIWYIYNVLMKAEFDTFDSVRALISSKQREFLAKCELKLKPNLVLQISDLLKQCYVKWVIVAQNIGNLRSKFIEAAMTDGPEHASLATDCLTKVNRVLIEANTDLNHEVESSFAKIRMLVHQEIKKR